MGTTRLVAGIAQLTLGDLFHQRGGIGQRMQGGQTREQDDRSACGFRLCECFFGGSHEPAQPMADDAGRGIRFPRVQEHLAPDVFLSVGSSNG